MAQFLKENVLLPLRNKTVPFYNRTFLAKSKMIAPYAEKCKMQEVDLFNFSVFVISLLVILVIGITLLFINSDVFNERRRYGIQPIISFSFLLVCENVFHFYLMPYYTYTRLVLFIFLYYFDGYEWFKRLIIDPVCNVLYDKVVQVTKQD